MAHSFDELVELQRAADQAYNRVEELRDGYGAPTASIWTGEQTEKNCRRLQCLNQMCERAAA
ncbi:hypothetical protein [Streptomyces sp. NPDC057072]|uniref:hypothetical protein n=1 Tax=Streptomyces sp. NPDC057072 TaxID=3346014 RepID=UPI003642CDAA